MATAGASITADAQAQTYRFGGRVQGWQGREPQAIADTTNPTLQLEAGTQYEVVWENLDGAPHDFTIQDANGNTLASTETMSSQGETRSLTFTASPEMAQYICTIHPTTMVGDIQLGDGGGEGGGGGGGDGGGEGGGGGGVPTLPDAAKMLGIVTMSALVSVLGLAYVFLKYGGDYVETEDSR